MDALIMVKVHENSADSIVKRLKRGLINRRANYSEFR